MKVIIATRFNVVFTEDQFARDKSGSPTRTPAWLTRRFELFEQVCLPSIMAQTHPEFAWTVFFSDGTPEPFLSRIGALAAAHPRMRPVFLRDGEYMVGRFKEEVARMLGPDDAHVMTLRIDNDDAFHRTMVERALRDWTGADDEIINYVDGLQCDLDHGLVAAAAEYSNPFIVRIERVAEGRARTVLDVMHTQVAETGVLRDLRGGPMWLQAIHGSNITNRIDSGRFLLRADLASGFGLRYPFKLDRRRTAVALARHHLVVAPLRLARRAGRALRRRLSA